MTIAEAARNTAPMLLTFLSVGLGGALGAMLRYGASLALARPGAEGLPAAILGVNVLGSFLMGLAVVVLQARDAQAWAPFVLAGLLGGFTTFSAFALEAVALLQRGAPGLAAIYVGLSVGLSILGLALGLWLARGALA